MKGNSRIVYVIGTILVLTCAHYWMQMSHVQAHDLFRRLYYLPIIYAAYAYGMRGGLAAAFLISLLYLPFILLRIDQAAERFDQTLEIVLYLSVGMITGLLSSRQKEAIHRLEIMVVGITRSLVTAIEAKDPYTKGHSVRVMHLATILGRKMNLPPAQLRILKMGALLHDVGKITLDLSILNKPSGLSDQETELMKKHPELGVRILGQIQELHDVLPAVLHHHERYDGSGYPQALQSTQIPLLARIISVADVFDALTSDRPYRAAVTPEEAIRKMRSMCGITLDPEVYSVLVTNVMQK